MTNEVNVAVSDLNKWARKCLMALVVCDVVRSFCCVFLKHELEVLSLGSRARNSRESQ